MNFKYIFGVLIFLIPSISNASGEVLIAPGWMGGHQVRMKFLEVEKRIVWSDPEVRTFRIAPDEPMEETTHALFLEMFSKEKYACEKLKTTSNEFNFKLVDKIQEGEEPFIVNGSVEGCNENRFWKVKTRSFIHCDGVEFDGAVILSNDDLAFVSPRSKITRCYFRPFTYIEFTCPEELHTPKGLSAVRLYPSSHEFLSIINKLEIDFRPDHFKVSVDCLNFGAIRLFFNEDK